VSHVRINIAAVGLKTFLYPLLKLIFLLYFPVLERVLIYEALVVLHEAVKVLLREAPKTVHYPLVDPLSLLVEQVLQFKVVDVTWNREPLLYLGQLELSPR